MLGLGLGLGLGLRLGARARARASLLGLVGWVRVSRTGKGYEHTINI